MVQLTIISVFTLDQTPSQALEMSLVKIIFIWKAVGGTHAVAQVIFSLNLYNKGGE